MDSGNLPLSIKLGIASILIDRGPEDAETSGKRAVPVAERLLEELNKEARKDGWTYEEYAVSGVYLINELLGLFLKMLSAEDVRALAIPLSDFAKEDHMRTRKFVSEARLSRMRAKL